LRIWSLFSTVSVILSRPGPRKWGHHLFVERGCSGCHGSHAEGTPHAPALRGPGKSFTLVTLATALWKDGPKMYRRTQEFNVQWPSLTEADTGNLVSFLNAPIQ
jgi:mono/diheme cytochrome c family protein